MVDEHEINVFPSEVVPSVNGDSLNHSNYNTFEKKTANLADWSTTV